MGWTRIGVAGWAGPSAVPIYRTKSHVAPHENINCGIRCGCHTEYQLVHNGPVDIFRHMPNMFRRLSMRMRVEPCLAESGRKGPPATSHVCTGAQGHFPREPGRPAEPGRDRNRSGKTNTTTKRKKKRKKTKNKKERHKKKNKDKKKRSQHQHKKHNKSKNTQHHPQTKTKTQEKIRCASCTWLRGNRRKRRISNEIKHCSWGFDSDIGLCGGCCVWKEYGKRTKTSTPFLCCVRETGGGEVPAVEQERQGGGLPHLPYHMQQEI